MRYESGRGYIPLVVKDRERGLCRTEIGTRDGEKY